MTLACCAASAEEGAPLFIAPKVLNAVELARLEATRLLPGIVAATPVGINSAAFDSPAIALSVDGQAYRFVGRRRGGGVPDYESWVGENGGDSLVLSRRIDDGVVTGSFHLKGGRVFTIGHFDSRTGHPGASLPMLIEHRQVAIVQHHFESLHLRREEEVQLLALLRSDPDWWEEQFWIRPDIRMLSLRKMAGPSLDPEWWADDWTLRTFANEAAYQRAQAYAHEQIDRKVRVVERLRRQLKEAEPRVNCSQCLEDSPQGRGPFYTKLAVLAEERYKLDAARQGVVDSGRNWKHEHLRRMWLREALTVTPWTGKAIAQRLLDKTSWRESIRMP